MVYLNEFFFKKKFLVFALWLNSLDVTPVANNLYEDLKVYYHKKKNVTLSIFDPFDPRISVIIIIYY